MRGVDVIREGRPHAVVSPGVNAMDADAIGVHMIFAQHAEARSTDPEGIAKRAHRWLYFRLLTRLETRVYSGSATIWAISGQDARELESRFGRPEGSVPVVPHGVDTNAFSPDRRETLRRTERARRSVDDRRVALIVGNDILKKGMDTAIRSLPEMPPDVVLAVAGSVDQDAIVSLADRAGVSNRVLTLGHVDDLVELFAIADVLIAPSREESFNLPVLEAMACGLPVVVSVTAGVSEQLSDGRDALLVSAGDEEALAKAVTAILDNSELASRLSEQGRQRVSSLTWDESAERAANVIETEITTPRLLVIATDAARTGGIQRVTRLLTRSLADAFGEERVAVVSVWRGDQPVAGRVLHPGDPMTADGRVGKLRAARFAFDAVTVARGWRRRLAIIAAHPHLAPVAWVAHAVSGAPYMVWCHGIEVWRPLGRATRFGLARADRVFAPSRFTASQVEARAGLAPGSVTVLPHPVPPEFAQVDPVEERIPGSVLTVARLHPAHAYKGVDLLIEIWAQVVEAVPGATLEVVGDGPDRARLERKARECGIGSAVKFSGRLTDEQLARRYRTASLFAMPARHRTGPRAQGEGFGLVYLEAAAAGLAVVAGRGGGVEDAVTHDESGLLVDPDDPEAILEAIVRVLSDGALARRLGEGGRSMATTTFSFEAFRDAVVTMLKELPVQGLVR
jgi:phosphatidylinositol alpha-1,6-mannosyltransferase